MGDLLQCDTSLNAGLLFITPTISLKLGKKSLPFDTIKHIARGNLPPKISLPLCKVLDIEKGEPFVRTFALK